MLDEWKTHSMNQGENVNEIICFVNIPPKASHGK